MAPVVGHGGIMVRIAGVLCTLRRIEGLPRRYRGWAVLRALSTSRAEFVGEAGLTQIADYLALFPAVRLILLRSQSGRWLSLPAHMGDRRFRIEGPVTLELAEEGLEGFETVVSRFDGHLFWYERRDPGRDPTIAAYLREQLNSGNAGGLPPKVEELRKRGVRFPSLAFLLTHLETYK